MLGPIAESFMPVDMLKTPIMRHSFMFCWFQLSSLLTYQHG